MGIFYLNVQTRFGFDLLEMKALFYKSGSGGILNRVCNYAWVRLPTVHPGDDGDLHQEELLRALRRRLHAHAGPQGSPIDVHRNKKT